MTENHVTCIRGCTMRCYDDHCLTVGQHDHPRLRRPAAVGLLCEQCSGRILDALSSIELYTPSLHLELDDTGDRAGHRGKISGSPALINLHSAVLLYDTDPADMAGDETGARSILGTFNYWIRLLHRATEQTPPAPSETVTVGLVNLKYSHSDLCAQKWADRYFKDIIDLAAEVRRAARAPQPIARCYGRINGRECSRYLYPPDQSVGGEAEIVCDRCGRRYTGAELVRLQYGDPSYTSTSERKATS